jgi:hypothetical protein
VTLLMTRQQTTILHHLPPEVEVIHGESGRMASSLQSKMDWANRVTSIGWADQVFVTVAQAR